MQIRPIDINFKKRRERILSLIDDNSVIIISTNKLMRRSNDTYYQFRPNSNFYYLTGFAETQSTMLLSSKEYIIFMQDKDTKKELWEGKNLGLAVGKKILGAITKNIKSIDVELPKIIAKYSKIYFDFDNVDKNLVHHLTKKCYESIKEKITKLRLVKDDLELNNIKKSCAISACAHNKAMQNIKSYNNEYEVHSVFDSYFRFNNVEHAYNPIVAAGDNANTLHYNKNDEALNNNDLILIDAGCEYDYYSSDITRTFPLNGKFNKIQYQLYNLVLETQEQTIKSIKVGMTLEKLDNIARNIIKNGLIALKIINDADDIYKFFPHNIGHFLGLDVHDVGTKNTKFKPNMVITVEPGIYLPKNAEIDKKYRGIGIRIEDDVLITKNGYKILTNNCLKNINDIENIIQ